MALALLLGVAQAVARPARASAGKAPIIAYRGLGTWVDMYDTVAWKDPAAAVADMASHGVRTLFIETSNYHWSTALNRHTDLDLFITRCHAHGMKVVAWYVPGFSRPTRDFNRSMAAIRYRTPDGQRFNSFALDIEASIVKPVSTRNLRLMRLSKSIRAAVGARYPLGAIIPSPAGMAMHTTYWPTFPYKSLAGVYDVMVPMGYYTYHGNGYGNAYRDTRNNVRIIRESTGRSTIPIHVIAGLAAQSSGTETLAYVRALRENGCVGGSMYDWSTTDSTDWKQLASVRFNPIEKPALPRDIGYLAPLGNCPSDITHPKEVFFQAPAQTGDVLLHFRLYDAQLDEIRLTVNWQGRGPLKPGPKGSWSGIRTVVIPASALNAKGRNVIGFVALGKEPPWHRWGVRDVTLSTR